jgi:hypothetical protein
MSVISANVAAKAARLCDSGCVAPIGIVTTCEDGEPLPSGPTEVFSVRGDRGDYAVVIGSGHVGCNCAARGMCSHIAGALLVRTRELHTPATRPARHCRLIQP